MFNLGMGEILVLGVIALIVVGPEKLPELARNVGRFINDIKRTTSDVTREISRSIDEKNFQASNPPADKIEPSESYMVDEPHEDHHDYPHDEEGHHDPYADHHDLVDEGYKDEAVETVEAEHTVKDSE